MPPRLILRHAHGTCSLGHILAAFTEHGLSALLLGDSPTDLLADLHHRFPTATLITAEASDTERLIQIIAFIDIPSANANASPLPLDMHGTSFQKRVWTALQTLPFGTTTTYSHLAAQIGSPTATRAVATACAANPIAIIVPCHRVVRADGSLAGYRWGLQRKQALLAREDLLATDPLPH